MTTQEPRNPQAGRGRRRPGLAPAAAALAWVAAGLGLTLGSAGCATQAMSPEAAERQIEAAEKAGVCHVHEARMAKLSVPIIYGLVGVPDEKRGLNAQATRFPFARHAVYGGCVFMESVSSPETSSPRFADLMICPHCESAKAGWVRAHPTNPWAKIWRYDVKPMGKAVGVEG